MHSFRENRLVALIWRLAGLSIGTYGLILMLQASSVKQQLCYFTVTDWPPVIVRLWRSPFHRWRRCFRSRR